LTKTTIMPVLKVANLFPTCPRPLVWLI
jgi:hypothetical protein